MAVQLQWGLDATAFSTLQSVREVIHAASTDNVQPNAIVACEGFGSTVAICPETCRKIEKTVVPAAKYVAVRIIAGFVGYSASDCVSHLGKSLAGTQFLSLAAVLVNTLPIYQAGDLVTSMLAESAADKTLVPSRRQTSDLLRSIEGRCYRAGFADEVNNWHILLKKILAENHKPDFETGQSEETWSRKSFGSAHPQLSGIKTLVDALRQLCHVGENQITKLTIRVSDALPWTVAFVKWCLGYPPSIFLEDGTSILVQPGSKVEVVAAHPSKVDFTLELHSSVSSLSRLVNTSSVRDQVGMMSIKAFGQRLLLEANLLDSSSIEALTKIIPFGIRQILQSWQNNLGGRLTTIPNFSGRIQVCRSSPFPDEGVIFGVCYHLFGFEVDTILPQFVGSFFHLPASKNRIEALGEKCSCDGCDDTDIFAFGCLIRGFKKGVMAVLETVLLLSLFEGYENLLASASYFNDHRTNSFQEVIERCLVSNAAAELNVSMLLSWAFRLVGHHESGLRPDGHRLIMSSCKGQTVWPMLYETNSISSRGFLRIVWLPGNLYYKNDMYTVVVGETHHQLRTPHTTETEINQTSIPTNTFTGVTTEWQITEGDRVLEASIIIKHPDGKYDSLGYSMPHEAILNLADAIWVKDCCHKRDLEFSGSSLPYTFIDPFLRPSPSFSSVDPRRRQRRNSETEKIQIVATSGSNLYLAALGVKNNYDRATIRGNACLNCCLEVCQQVDSGLLFM